MKKFVKIAISRKKNKFDEKSEDYFEKKRSEKL